ncbi:MAG: Flp family type IVb pilin [Planctomycetota bacterium]|nr:Flp family type IVb pilin [Planctomycetota bacterium]MCY2987908.1 Flp family type IVb pilin [Planctomycetota bacterium]
MLTILKRFVREEEGATMVEYGLMVALIAVVCIAAVSLVGTAVNSKFTTVASSVAS